MTASTRTLSLTALNPNATGRRNYAADPATTALLIEFYNEFFQFNQDPGQPCNPAEAQATGMNMVDWISWNQFPFWTDSYRKKQSPAPGWKWTRSSSANSSGRICWTTPTS